MHPEYIYIDTIKKLDDFCSSIDNKDFITIDTEFIRESSYYPRICLIQIATKNTNVVIDMLAQGMEIAPLYDILLNPNIVKVMHSARQDMEAFLYYLGALPKNIYDTQIAASVCGFGDSIGYNKIVYALLNKHVDKTCRTSDWAQRPLTQKQIYYAINDVTYLREVYSLLIAQIATKNRNHWIAEELTKINDPNTYKVDIQQQFYKIKLSSIKPYDLARAFYLVKLREQLAEEYNKPRKHVLSNDLIADLAQQNPDSLHKLSKTRGIQKYRLSLNTQNKLLTTLKEASNINKQDCPTIPKANHNIKQLTYELLKLALRYISEKHEVSESIISSVDNLQKFIINPENQKLPINQGWRKEIFGNIAHDLINEKSGFAINNGNLTLIDQ